MLRQHLAHAPTRSRNGRCRRLGCVPWPHDPGCRGHSQNAATYGTCGPYSSRQIGAPASDRRWRQRAADDLFAHRPLTWRTTSGDTVPLPPPGWLPTGSNALLRSAQTLPPRRKRISRCTVGSTTCSPVAVVSLMVVVTASLPSWLIA